MDRKCACCGNEVFCEKDVYMNKFNSMVDDETIYFKAYMCTKCNFVMLFDE